MKQILNENTALIQSSEETVIASKCTIFTDDDVEVTLLNDIIKSTGDEVAQIKVILTLNDSANLIKAFPELLDYIKTNDIIIVYTESEVTILLDKLYPEHEKLFLNFNAKIIK